MDTFTQSTEKLTLSRLLIVSVVKISSTLYKIVKSCGHLGWSGLM